MKSPTALVYGPPKIGKTVSAVRALGPSAFWICTERGALTPAYDSELNPWKTVPDHVELLDPVRPLEQVQQAIKTALAQCRQGKYAAIVIDTLSALAEREFYRIRQLDHVVENYGKAARVLADKIQAIIWEIMNSDVILIAIAHESEPSQIEGRFRPGGPKLPGRLVEGVPSMFDIVLRSGVELGPDGALRRVFRCDPLDRNYVTGDRFNVCAPVEPMDLKDILKRAVNKSRAITAA